jgi:hypothetical protein
MESWTLTFGLLAAKPVRSVDSRWLVEEFFWKRPQIHTIWKAGEDTMK